MTVSWVAIGRYGDTWLACLMDGAVLMEETFESTREEALFGKKVRPERVIEIGGDDAVAPIALLPEAGKISEVVQARPADRLAGWARIEIAGFLDTRPNWDGVICRVTRDNTYWIHVSANEIVSFQGFATGRIIVALGGAETANIDAMDDAISRPETLALLLRRAELAEKPDAVTGALLGAELAATKPYWLGQAVGLIGSEWPYVAALDRMAVPSEQEAPEDMRARGLAVVARRFGFAKLDP